MMMGKIDTNMKPRERFHGGCVLVGPCVWVNEDGPSWSEDQWCRRDNRKDDVQHRLVHLEPKHPT